MFKHTNDFPQRRTKDIFLELISYRFNEVIVVVVFVGGAGDGVTGVVCSNCFDDCRRDKG